MITFFNILIVPHLAGAHGCCFMCVQLYFSKGRSTLLSGNQNQGIHTFGKKCIVHCNLLFIGKYDDEAKERAPYRSTRIMIKTKTIK